MRRRRFLAGALGSLATALAGCSATDRGGQDSETRTATPAPTPTPSTVRERGIQVELPVPSEEIRTAVAEDSIPAITDPAFASDWEGLSVPDGATHDGGPLLPEDSAVVGVERDGEARAYPLRVLDHHEVVNDEFGGPLLVTYCPLCGSTVVAERRVDGEPTTFGVSGKLWRNDLVMYDAATESLWSQLLATAIRGPRTGERLSIHPASLTSWGEWQRRHPETQVLLPPPESEPIRTPAGRIDYFSDKYSYDEDALIGYDRAGEDLPPRTLVLGVTVDGEARAYPREAVAEADGVVNDTLAGTPLAVTTTPDGSMAAYDRRVGGQAREFRAAGDRHFAATGSRWTRATGRAVDGPYAGRTLDTVHDIPPLFWVGWSNFYPDSSVYEP